MNKSMKKLFYYLITLIISINIISCSEDSLGKSIFGNDIDTEKNEFDTWLEDSIRSQYNIMMNYRWEDVESDMKYNLIPAEYDKSFKLAQYVKYLWLGSYDELTGNRDFLSLYVPKVIQFVGSPAVNKDDQTIVLGTAEGGMKITLYNVNDIDLANPSIEKLNQYYFNTMHHEFAHILHQTKNYPMNYNEISAGKYSSSGWQNRSEKQAWELGFITPYSSKEPQEDFVEMISNYVTNPKKWAEMKAYNKTDTISINKKFTIVDEWLKTSWDIDIDELRDIVTRRSANINNI